MKTRLKKRTYVIAIVVVVLSSLYLTAYYFSKNEESDCEYHEEQCVYACEAEPAVCVPVAPVEEVEPRVVCFEYDVFDPTDMRDDEGVWLSVEALCWRAQVDGLQYAMKSTSQTLIQHGRLEEPDFEWSWGGRAGIGFHLPNDYWDLYLSYTHIRGNAHGHVSAPKGDTSPFPLPDAKPPGALYPTWAVKDGFAGPSFYASRARVKWHASVNIGDFELGRTNLTSGWLTLRPFCGIRAIGIDQGYNVRYSGGTAFPGDKDKVHIDNDFWGVGIRLGADSLFGMGGGLSFYNKLSASLLSGHFHVNQTAKLANAGTYSMRVKRSVNNVVTTADFTLGLQWDRSFSKDQYHLGMNVGWEYALFFDQNLTIDPNTLNIQSNNIAFGGVSFGIRLDF